jgi:excinuclease ABC subunit A
VAASDWVVNIGPDAGDEGGHVVAAGTPDDITLWSGSRTAEHLGIMLS